MFSLGGTFTLRAARLSLAHRILIHPASLKWPLSLRGTSGERAGERGALIGYGWALGER